MKLLKVLLTIFSILSLTATGFLYRYAGQIYVFDHLVVGLPEMFLCVSALWIFTMGILIVSSVEASRENLALAVMASNKVAEIKLERDCILRGKMESEVVLTSLCDYASRTFCNAEFKPEHYTQTVDKVFIKELENLNKIISIHEDGRILLTQKIDALTKDLAEANAVNEALLVKTRHVEFVRQYLTDTETRRGWKDNIAMAFKDTYAQHMKKKRSPSNADIHTIGNKAAEHFLKLLTGK